MSAKTRFCAVCKKEIEDERRVDAETGEATMTRLCREHAEKIEEFGGEFKRSFTQERTNKRESLKKNYGGITVKLTRNDEAIELLREQYLEEQMTA